MQRSYQRKFDKCVIGQPSGVFGGYARFKPYRNSSGGVKETWTVAIPAPAADTTYKLKVNGGTAIVKIDDDVPTQTEFNTQFFNKVRTNPLILSFCYASLSANTITIEAREAGDTLIVVGTGVTATKTLTAVKPTDVPFGRFVARGATEDDSLEARLVNNVADKILGMACAPYDVEREGIGEKAYAAFFANEMMDVCVDTVGWDGFWVEAEQDDIQITDTPYISLTAGFEGAISKLPTGNIPMTGLRARIEEKAQLLSTGKCAVLLSFHAV